jgi:inner membrane protein
MMARSHVALGLAAWISAAPLLHLPPLDPVSAGLAVMGSLLPDVDHPRSWVGRRTRPVSSLLAAALGHRGITHSAVAVLALALLLARAGGQRRAVWPVVVGYASHLAADMLTARGLRLAWPLRRSWGVPLCRAGSPAEALIVAAACAAAVWRLARPGWWAR